MLPLSLSSTAWALVAALGGAFLGAIVGAIATVALTAYVEHRRTTRLARSGARLLQGDLSIAGHQIQGALIDGRWYGFYRWHDANWQEYKGVLVERLDGADFDAVAQATRGTKDIFATTPEAPRWPKGKGWMPIPAPSRKGLEDVTEEIVGAYNILCPLTDDPPITLDDIRHPKTAEPDSPARG